MTTARIMLIPCSHFNREGEAALRACYVMRSRYPKRFIIVTPSTIGVSPLVLESFGVDPKNHVAVNGCAHECVNKVLAKECGEESVCTITLEEKPTLDPRSALNIDDTLVNEYAATLEKFLADHLKSGDQ